MRGLVSLRISCISCIPARSIVISRESMDPVNAHKSWFTTSLLMMDLAITPIYITIPLSVDKL